MNEVYVNRSGQGRAPEGAGTIHPPLRICINVPMGTPYRDIQELVLRQAYKLMGTQLRAAFALGITPETISRVLRRGEKRRAAQDGVQNGSADSRAEQVMLKALEIGRIADPVERAARIAKRLSRFDDLFADGEDTLSSGAAGEEDAVPDV